MDLFRVAVLHTAKKRNSIEALKDWQDILKDIYEEKALYSMWNNYLENNEYICKLDFNTVLESLSEIAEVLDF